ncbi:hypothetical protein EUX98_g8134 [Antrodiella citrinella]|uniref:Uncharacterized protein n=1 Tax=Antrodiella citrinella TaxID=2447956 RepID=A0A4V3XGW9_9APHY|nr:hypothetical protein EUX98_g8134 [Antrodiella citrinella]
MTSFLGCFGALFPRNSRTRALAVLAEEDDDLEVLIESASNSDVSSEGSSLSSHGDTVTSASSFRGMGSLSGKAIMAVGNMVIKGIEVVDIQVRLRRIASQLDRDGAGMSSVATIDLIELQRAGLYPPKVRRRAMQLVMLVMCRRAPYRQLVQAVLQQPLEEIRLFLEQLWCLKISSENLVPRLIAQLSEEDNAAYQEKRQSSLSDRFCDLILTIIKKHPSILLDSDHSSSLFGVVLYSIGMGRGDEIDLSEWDETDVQIFIRKLNSLRQSAWLVLPFVYYLFLVLNEKLRRSCLNLEECPFLSTTMALENGSRKILDHREILDSFCDIVSDIVETRPSLLCRAFSVEEVSDILALLFERRHFRSIISTLLASSSEDVRHCLFKLARSPRPNTRQPGFLIDIDEREVIARTERQANFSDLLRRIFDWHPHFLHEVFDREKFTVLIITAVDDAGIPPNWQNTHLLMYHFANRGSLSPLRDCFTRFVVDVPPAQP